MESFQQSNVAYNILCLYFLHIFLICAIEFIMEGVNCTLVEKCLIVSKTQDQILSTSNFLGLTSILVHLRYTNICPNGGSICRHRSNIQTVQNFSIMDD